MSRQLVSVTIRFQTARETGAEAGWGIWAAYSDGHQESDELTGCEDEASVYLTDYAGEVNGCDRYDGWAIVSAHEPAVEFVDAAIA